MNDLSQAPQQGPTPPDWYGDPLGSGLRYWDGSAWTEHVAPAAPAAEAAPGQEPAAEPGPDVEDAGDGASPLEWVLSVVFALLPLVGLIWGVYLMRRGDGSEPAGILAVGLSVLVLVVGALLLFVIEPSWAPEV